MGREHTRAAMNRHPSQRHWPDRVCVKGHVGASRATPPYQADVVHMCYRGDAFFVHAVDAMALHRERGFGYHPDGCPV